RTDSIYLEAFALYRFQATFGGQVLLTLLPSAGLFLHELVLDSAPLTALAWLHLRGASVVTIRRDSGLIWRRGSLRECGAGLLCFALLAPLTLTLLQDAQPDTSLGAQILLGGMALTAAKAVLYAPLIEEFFFRGLLHRHLRTRHGFVFTASATTLVFVTMHTQHDVGGLALVACMGFLMSVLREWRSSLVAAITMHATVNGVPILILLALFFL
ncbi:MAG: CPBP family intramembrane glutamic endopeptidase, partial [Planctomycetota bacterium]